MQDLNLLPLPELFGALTADGGLDRLLEAAMEEDARAPGDITTDSIIATDQQAEAKVVARQEGRVAGLPAMVRLVERDGRCSAMVASSDGAACQAGEALAILKGPLRSLLGIERTLLNVVGRLSGIATVTHQYVTAIAGTKATICDTRKTTPGLRNLEKYAVRCGGGTLHRLGLYDAALYKDNHLAGIPLEALARRLTEAIVHVRSQHEVRFVEVEVDRLEQLSEVLGMERGLIDFILLDNMPLEALRDAVARRDREARHIKLEASGGVNLSTVRAIAETGVDRISVGAITHSAPCLDVALDIEA